MKRLEIAIIALYLAGFVCYLLAVMLMMKTNVMTFIPDLNSLVEKLATEDS